MGGGGGKMSTPLASWENTLALEGKGIIDVTYGVTLPLIFGDFLKTPSPNLKKLARFFEFQSIFILSIHGCKQQRIASVSIIFWSSLLQRLLVF